MTDTSSIIPLHSHILSPLYMYTSQVGFWLTLGTAVVTGVLSFGQYLLNKSHFDEEHGSGEGLFHPSQFRRVDGSAAAPSACKTGCCGGGGGGGGAEAQDQLVQPRPQYGAV